MDKAGCCMNPASSQRSAVMKQDARMPTAAMAGSFSRKVTAERYACGKAEMVPVMGKAKELAGKHMAMQTRKIPAYVAAPAASSGQDTASKSQRMGKQHQK